MAKILIADDDDLLVDLVRFKLEAKGHRVVTAMNGSEALRMVGAEKPDLLVLDSMMPVLSGSEVLRSIRSSEDTADLPVVMLTARKGQDDVVTALQAGAMDYVTKPFIPDELLVRIEGILRASKAQSA